jgi:hypothetical protein
MYAVHIRNLSPTSALPNVVPYEAWTGRKPDVSHLRVFGSVAYANILGWWANETKGYRLEDVETRALVTSRDVRFIEDDTTSDLVEIDGSASGVPAPITVPLIEAGPISDPRSS